MLSFLIILLLHALPTAFLAGKLHSHHGLPLPETENALKTAFHPPSPRILIPQDRTSTPPFPHKM
jgi:hypothetical protein